MSQSQERALRTPRGRASAVNIYMPTDTNLSEQRKHG
jgi:hypothetical protein